MKCAHLIVSGRVQGVFFRANVKSKARELGLRGYAKNLENGDAEVVAQGNEEKITELIGFIKNNPGHSKVENIKRRNKITENFKTFEVNH